MHVVADEAGAHAQNSRGREVTRSTLQRVSENSGGQNVSRLSQVVATLHTPVPCMPGHVPKVSQQRPGQRKRAGELPGING